MELLLIFWKYRKQYFQNKKCARRERAASVAFLPEEPEAIRSAERTATNTVRWSEPQRTLKLRKYLQRRGFLCYKETAVRSCGHVVYRQSFFRNTLGRWWRSMGRSLETQCIDPRQKLLSGRWEIWYVHSTVIYARSQTDLQLTELMIGSAPFSPQHQRISAHLPGRLCCRAGRRGCCSPSSPGWKPAPGGHPASIRW